MKLTKFSGNVITLIGIEVMAIGTIAYSSLLALIGGATMAVWGTHTALRNKGE